MATNAVTLGAPMSGMPGRVPTIPGDPNHMGPAPGEGGMVSIPSRQELETGNYGQGDPRAYKTTAAPVGATPMTTAAPGPVSQPGTPPIGLIGAEQALQGGASQARTDIQGAMAGTEPDVYTQGGQGAAQLQADLTGANGPEAQAAAQAQMSQSPAAQYQMEQMQRATERSAAARGGLMGGNVLQELQRNAAGIASQDYQNQFANLGSVADRGMQRQTMQDQMKTSLSRDLADTAMSAGIQTAGLRTQAGQQVAQNASSAASQISQLLNQQGVAVSDMVAKDISTITDMIYQSGLQENLNTNNLAAILANISGGQASTVAQGQAQIGAADAAGTIGVGNAIQGGITQGIATWQGGQPTTTTAPNTNVGMVGAGQQYGGYA